MGVGMGVGTAPADRVQHLRRARDLIDLRFADPLTLSSMAAEAGFSRFHFARSARASPGNPINLTQAFWAADT
jgi:AraC-like DNA-binding protein